MAGSSQVKFAGTENGICGSAAQHGAGWNPVRRGAWQTPELLALKRERPEVFGTFAWLHQFEMMRPVPGVLVSSAVSLPQLLASHLLEEPEQIEQHLLELQRRGFVLVEGACFYIPSQLADTCAAPTSGKQVRSWAAQVMRLPAALRARVQRDLLDVTARADVEREKRRKDGAEPIFEQLKRALGVQLVSLPHDGPQQLTLPKVRMNTNDLDEQALCMLALIESSSVPGASGIVGTAVKASCGADRMLPVLRPVGPEQPPLSPRVETTLSGTPFYSGEHHGQGEREPGAGRHLAAQARDAAGALRHVADRAPARGAARDGACSGSRGGDGPVAAGRGGGAAVLRAAGGAVSEGLRSDQARLQLLEVWGELQKRLPELVPQRSYRDRLSGEISTGLPGKLHHALVDGFVQTQQADPPAKLEDFQLLAEWVRAGGLHYLKPVEWCAHLCGSLPVVLEKAAAWKRDKKPDPRAKVAAPEQKPAAPTQHYHAPAKRFFTQELRSKVDAARDESPQRIADLMKAAGMGK